MIQRALPSCTIIFNVSRGLQHQTSTQKSTETYPWVELNFCSLSISFLPRPQSRKPKFDSVHFEESVKPYAEDITLENQYEKWIFLISCKRNSSFFLCLDYLIWYYH